MYWHIFALSIDVVFLFIFKVCSEEGQEENFILELLYCVSQSESGFLMYFIFIMSACIRACLMYLDVTSVTSVCINKK